MAGQSKDDFEPGCSGGELMVQAIRVSQLAEAVLDPAAKRALTQMAGEYLERPRRRAACSL